MVRNLWWVRKAVVSRDYSDVGDDFSGSGGLITVTSEVDNSPIL